MYHKKTCKILKLTFKFWDLKCLGEQKSVRIHSGSSAFATFDFGIKKYRTIGSESGSVDDSLFEQKPVRSLLTEVQ